ncbi:MAG: hypothetical protein ACLVDF_03145 [Acutalibacteraceae bacterium]
MKTEINQVSKYDFVELSQIMELLLWKAYSPPLADTQIKAAQAKKDRHCLGSSLLSALLVFAA